MNDSDFMRYSRQLLLDEFSPDAQLSLAASQVLIIGLGGLGAPAALYLATSGVGHITLVDDDAVHVSNLQRQILFCESDISRNKAQAAAQALRRHNAACQLRSIEKRLEDAALQSEVAAADIVLDCTDNIASRQAINAACVAENTPLITASAVGFNGQFMVLTPPWRHGCYRCLYPEDAEPERNCRTAGILGPVVGMMGLMQALEAIKLLSGIDSQHNQLHLFDASRLNWQRLNLTRSPNCPVCGGLHASMA